MINIFYTDKELTTQEFPSVPFRYDKADFEKDVGLIDVTEQARSYDYRFPVAITKTLWIQWIETDDTVISPRDKRIGECLLMAKRTVSQPIQDEYELQKLFPFSFVPDFRTFRLVDCYLLFCPDEAGRLWMIITIPRIN